MHPNQQTIEAFYSAFARLDPDAMAPCYAEGVAFEDEVFTLTGKQEVMGMWRMLCEATKGSRQALGAPGVLLGWTPMLRRKVRGQAGSNLRKFIAKAS